MFIINPAGFFKNSHSAMDNRNARASDGHQEEGKKYTYGETLRRVL
jgi:hypothetical protein